MSARVGWLGGSAAYVDAAALGWLRTAWQSMSTILKEPFKGSRPDPDDFRSRKYLFFPVDGFSGMAEAD